MATVNNLAGAACDVVAGLLEWSGRLWRRQADLFYEAHKKATRWT